MDIWPQEFRNNEKCDLACRRIEEYKIDLFRSYLKSNVEVSHFRFNETGEFDVTNDNDFYHMTDEGYVSLSKFLIDEIGKFNKNSDFSSIVFDEIKPLSADVLSFAPIGSVGTYFNSLIQSSVLSLESGIINIVSKIIPIELLGISFITTLHKSFIVISTDKECFYFDMSAPNKPIKKVYTLPNGLICSPLETVKIYTTSFPPLHAKRLPINNRFRPSINHYRAQRSLSVHNYENSGICELIFDNDSLLMDITYENPCINEKKLPPNHSLPRLKIAFYGFWSGFDANNCSLFSELQQITVSIVDNLSDSDVIFASVFVENFDLEKSYNHLKSFNKPIIFVTGEHTNVGLPGFNQLNFYNYYACMSPYYSNSPSHIWLPLIAFNHGWNCAQLISNIRSQMLNKRDLANVHSKAVFCYSNATHENSFRNQVAEILLRHNVLHSCGKVYNNTNGDYAPRGVAEFSEYCSAYKAYLAFENASFLGYRTEKLYNGIMSGAHTFYWGDPSALHDLNPKIITNLTDVSPEVASTLILNYIEDNSSQFTAKSEGEWIFNDQFTNALSKSKQKFESLLISIY